MKFRSLILFFIAIFLIPVACDPYKIEIPNQGITNGGNTGSEGDNTGEGTTEVPTSVTYPASGVAKVKTLQTVGYFRENTIKTGITHYSFYGMDDVTKAPQNVNVLEVDLNNPAYKINFYYTSRSKTSEVGKNNNAIAAINAAFEQEAIYNRTNGVNHSEVTLEKGHLRYWKHEAAMVGDGQRKIGIIYGAKGAKNIDEGGEQALKIYKQLTEKNIFASAPMLIDEFEPVGVSFVPDYLTSSYINGLEYEDYRRHQGVRHPRTAVALTEDNDLLLITVDGRFPGNAEGMSAKELTLFIAKHFNPRWAMNFDGGGSTTMYIKGAGTTNDVVNHPSNTGSTWDSAVERDLSTFILVQYNE